MTSSKKLSIYSNTHVTDYLLI